MFNTLASELKASLYGHTASGLSLIELDNSGNLLVSTNTPVEIGNSSITVSGSVEISSFTGPVTIANDSLTVNGSVGITGDVTIGNDSLTVNGSVGITGDVTIANDSLTVNGTVAVSSITGDVTIGNDSLTISVGGHVFAEDSDDLVDVTGTDVVFDNTDISQITTASFLVYNTGSADITISLQLSPTTASAFYINDPAYTNTVITASENMIITVNRFAKYARLQYTLDSVTASFSAYYNAQM